MSTTSAASPGPPLASGPSAHLLRAIAACIRIESPDEFRQWVACHLQPLFPHEMLYCCVGSVNAFGIAVSEFLGLNFPAAYVEEITDEGGNVACPVMSKWLRERHTQIFTLDSKHANLPEKWLAAFRKHDLRNIAAHGVVDPKGATMSYFSFSRIPGHLGPSHAVLLEIMVPHMHQAFVRTLTGWPSTPVSGIRRVPVLTKREELILSWLTAGKSNWEIAAIVGSCENTVKNQVSSVLAKLGVSSRTQAATRALSLGYVPPAK